MTELYWIIYYYNILQYCRSMKYWGRGDAHIFEIWKIFSKARSWLRKSWAEPYFDFLGNIFRCTLNYPLFEWSNFACSLGYNILRIRIGIEIRNEIMSQNSDHAFIPFRCMCSSITIDRWKRQFHISERVLRLMILHTRKKYTSNWSEHSYEYAKSTFSICPLFTSNFSRDIIPFQIFILVRIRWIEYLRLRDKFNLLKGG